MGEIKRSPPWQALRSRSDTPREILSVTAARNLAMLLQIENLLSLDAVTHMNQVMDQAKWIDGRVTAGHQSERVKYNLQLPEDSDEARELGEIVLAALSRNALFVS